MARPRLHSIDDLLDVAEQIVTSGDPARLTLRALAAAAGASNGTIYHAFRSKDDLLARLWLRASSRLQRLASEAVGGARAAGDRDGADVIVTTALTLVEFVRAHPQSARLFFAQRRDQLFSHDLSADVEAELAAVQKRFIALLISLAQGMWGRGDRAAVDAVTLCVVDLPTGILRRRLLEGQPSDETTTARLEAAVRAVLAVPLEPRRTTPTPENEGNR